MREKDMAVEAGFMNDVYARLQLLSCGLLVKFNGWAELASDLGLPGKTQDVKQAVYWLGKSPTARVTHTSPTGRQDDGGHMRQTKHSIQVPLSIDQKKVLDRVEAAEGRRLTVIINGPYDQVLAEFFDVSEAATIVEAFVKRGRLSKDVVETKTRRATYTLVS